jgi:hypothetical protein
MRTWDSRWQRGFRLGLGEPAAERLVPLPWTNLDQVTVLFDRAVTVGKDDLVLRGTRGGEYRPVSVVSDSSGFLATWTFDRPFEADRYEMTLDDGPTGAADGGQHLDGEWPGALNYSSGDGVSGGDFRLDFNVLPGDVNRDGRVLADDFSAVKRKFFTTPANPGSGAGIYTIFHDVDGSGGILADDFSEVKRRFFTTLPARGMAASAGAATLLREQPSRRRLFGNEPVFG